jgi:hypothetical protein
MHRTEIYFQKMTAATEGPEVFVILGGNSNSINDFEVDVHLPAFRLTQSPSQYPVNAKRTERLDRGNLLD